MRYFHLAVAGWLLSGLAPAGRADEPPGKGPSTDGAAVSAQEIDRLIIQLGDDDTAKRALAKKRLEAIGEPAVASLKKAAEAAEDPEVRTAAKGLVQKFDAKASGMMHVFDGHGDRVNGVAISADGKRAISASFDGSLRYWDLDDHTLIRQIGGNGSSFNSVALSPDGKRLLSGGVDGAMRLWDLDTGTEVRTFAHPSQVWDMPFSPDGKTVLSGCADGNVRLWDLESGKMLQTLATDMPYAWTAAFTPDAKWAVTGGGTISVARNPAGTLRLWDLETGKELRRFEGHTSAVRHVVVSPDGKQILSASFDGTVRLWDLTTGKELKKFDGPGNLVESVAFTPDGKRAICCYGTNRAAAQNGEGPRRGLKLFDLATGREIKQFQGHDGPVMCFAVSADGRRLVSGSADKTMRLWEIPK